MTTFRARPRRAIVAGLFALALAGCSGGGAYPSRPILLVCPWAANGGTDRVARQVAMLLEQELGVNVNVINATGGEGVTGHAQGASAMPDGYTLTLMTVEINMLRWRGRTKLSYHDFDPLVLMNRDPAGVFVRKDAPWSTLAELEAAVRSAPGSLRASGTAQGGIWHLALAGWLAKVGLGPTDVIWVASQGSTPALRDLLAGGVEIVACSVAEARTLLQAGEVRALGVMGEARSPLLPAVPTLAEQGVEWTMGVWRGVGLPRGTPQRVRAVLEPALLRVVTSARFLEYMETEGFGAAAFGPEEFSRTLAQADERMKALLTSPAFRSLSQSRFGAMTFPGALLGLLLLVGGTAAARGLLRPDAASPKVGPEGWGRLGGALALVAAYVALSGAFGFVLTAAPLVLVALLRLGNGLKTSILTSAAAVLVAYLVFGKLLRVPFPPGPLPW
jgi:tripartite-type tricarboxylate transporter receptor subunit TctC